LQQRFALANPGVPLLRTSGGEDREGRGGEDSRGGEELQTGGGKGGVDG